MKYSEAVRILNSQDLFTVKVDEGPGVKNAYYVGLVVDMNETGFSLICRAEKLPIDYDEIIAVWI